MPPPSKKQKTSDRCEPSRPPQYGQSSVTSPSAASSARTAETDNRVVRVSLDYGTTKATLCGHVVDVTRGDQQHPLKELEIFEIPFSHGNKTVPQKLAFKNKKLLWGYEVDDALENGEIEEDDVITNLKLLIYQEFKDSPEGKRIQEQLKKNDVTLIELLTLHLRKLWEAVVDEAKMGLLGVKKADIGHLPFELYLSVPYVWDPPACRWMVVAAEEAGYNRVEPVREQVAAAAYWLHALKDKIAHDYHAGDEVLIGDLGGGTQDWIRVRFLSECSEGAKIKLVPVGEGAGSIFCGEHPNVMCREYTIHFLAREHGGIHALCVSFNITESALLASVLAQFDPIKKKFSERTSKPQVIYIRGAKAGQVVIMELSVDTMKKFFERSIKEAQDCITKMHEESKGQVKGVMLLGGYAQSRYVYGTIEKHCKLKNIVATKACVVPDPCLAVSKGAIMRWQGMSARGNDSGGEFGIAQEQEYVPGVHPDASKENGKVLPGTFEVGTECVFERWVPLTAADERAGPGKRYTRSIWQYHRVHCTVRSLIMQIFWTNLPLNRNDPIRDGANSEANLRKGVAEWGPPLNIALREGKDSLLKRNGFDPVRIFDGRGKQQWVYQFYTLTELRGEGASIEVSVKVARPGMEPYDMNGIEREGDVMFEIHLEERAQLCRETHTPFPRPA